MTGAWFLGVASSLVLGAVLVLYFEKVLTTDTAKLLLGVSIIFALWAIEARIAELVKVFKP